MYLVVFNSDNRLFLALNDDTSIRAFATEQDIMDEFQSFKEWFKSPDFTQRNSAAIGMIQLLPTVITAPESAEDIKKYLLTGQPLVVRPWATHPYNGVEVTKDILDLKTDLDIWKNLMRPDISPGEREREFVTI